MQFATGSYTGDGNDNRWINDPGFQPDLVVIKGATGARYCIFKTSSMAGDTATTFSTGDALFADVIQAFGANGFQVGTSTHTNANGVTFHWMAFRDNGAGDFAVGSYTGDGNDNRNLDVVGFQPTILWIKDGTNGERVVWRVAENTGDDSLHVHALANIANAIQSFRPTGFQVGTSVHVNTLNQTYYWVAFKDVANFIETGSYTGNGVDDRDITVGFDSDLVFVKGDTAQYAVLRTDTMAGDLSGPFHSVALAANQIQELKATAFEVGTDAQVNSNGLTYYWAAWKIGTTGAAAAALPILSDQAIHSLVFGGVTLR